MTYEEAIRLATDEYRRILPSPIKPLYSELEWWWLTSLAGQASSTWTRLVGRYPPSMTVYKALGEGVRWHVRVNHLTYRQAGLMVINGEDHSIPPHSPLITADMVQWAKFWDEWYHHVLVAFLRQDPAVKPFSDMLLTPRWVRTPGGWVDVRDTYQQFVESARTPGPKPRSLMTLCINVLRAFPPPINYPERMIDLCDRATRVIHARERRLTEE